MHTRHYVRRGVEVRIGVCVCIRMKVFHVSVCGWWRLGVGSDLICGGERSGSVLCVVSGGGGVRIDFVLAGLLPLCQRAPLCCHWALPAPFWASIPICHVAFAVKLNCKCHAMSCSAYAQGSRCVGAQCRSHVIGTCTQSGLVVDLATCRA